MTSVTMPIEAHAEAGHRDRQDRWVPVFRGGALAAIGASALAQMFAAAVLKTGGVLPQGVLSLAAAALVLAVPQQRWQLIIVAIAYWASTMGAIDLLMVVRHQRVRC